MQLYVALAPRRNCSSAIGINRKILPTRMKSPLQTADELRRLKTLRKYELLDTLPEQSLDDLTALAALVCEAPISLISLVDENRLWSKSRVGVFAGETPRENSFCGHAILQPELFIVADAALDERFADNPLVTGEPNIRFYAGAPLVTPQGHALGTLCIMDRVPRELTESQRQALRVLSRQVMAQLELRRQTRELAVSKARSRTVTDTTQVGLAIVNPEHRYRYANPAYSKILRLPLHDPVGQRVADVLPSVYPMQIRPRLERAFRGERVNYELTVPSSTPGQEVQHYAVTYEPVAEEAEARVVVVVVDITERKAAEAALREVHDRLLKIVATTPGIICTFRLRPDGSACFPYGFERLAEHYGIPPERLTEDATPFFAMVHPDDLGGLRETIAESARRLSPFHHEWRVRHPVRGQLWIEGHSMPLREPDGGTLWHGLASDITARKRAEEDLLRERRMLRTLIDHLPVCLYVKDTAGRFLLNNLANARMLGVTAESEIVGKTVFDFFPAEIARLYDADDKDVVLTGAPVSGREEPYEAEGKRGWFATTKVPLRGGQNEIVGLVGISQDITGPKQDEERIKRLYRVYSVLSGISQAIVHEKDSHAMLEKACRIVVEKGQFRLAWIGLQAAPGPPMSITAHAGTDEDALKILRSMFDEKPREGACAFTLHALQTGQHGVCNDIAGDPQAASWREPALQRGYRALAALPLKAGKTVIGTFNLYADTPDFFDEDELKLLDELAADISFALEVAQREAERRKAEDRHTRQRNTLLTLASQRAHASDDVIPALGLLAEAAARTLDIARVSVWRYNQDRSSIECVALFELEAGRHSSGAGAKLSAATHPAYFRALAAADVIAADDAVSDWRTSEFADDYLGPLGIRSMLDVSINIGGVRAGVLCHEHIGPPRQWTEDEKNFAVALGNLAALTLESWERRQAERALRVSEERFRQLAENIQEVFWIADPARNRILYVSPAYEKVWGRTCASLYESTCTWRETVHADDRERVLRAVETKKRSGDYDETYRILRPDNSVRWVRERAFPVRTTTGEVLRIVGTAEDITERRQLEEQFRQSQKMESIGQLAGGVAHDFNNILAAIMMQADLTAMLPDLPQEAREGVSEIRASTERAANLTRQLLAFSRRQVMQPRPLDLNGIVTSLTKMLQRILGEDVHLQLNLHPRPLRTRADGGMLDHLLLNLVVNARDAMPGGGRLFLETAERTFTEEEAAAITDASPGRHVCLSVTDTGFGIAPENLSRIFEPFFTTKEPGKGTGLGLATVFGIVKQHHGALTVESEVGQGTTFRIFLPATDATGESPTGESPEATGRKPWPRGGPETILLVEDEPSVRRVTRVMLERVGYSVLEAAHGLGALKVWEQHQDKIQLLLTDIVMPEGMSGRELARRLQESRPGLRIIFTSGYSADIAGRELALQEGQNFIQKPASPRQILETVRQCLDGDVGARRSRPSS